MTTSIFSLNHESLKKLLLQSANYVDLDLPSYIDFQRLLDALSSLDDRQIPVNNARNYSDVNYKIFLNQDGFYAWRQFEIIHPALYVHLVNQISTHWDEISAHVSQAVQDNSNIGIDCASQLWCDGDRLADPITSWQTFFEQQTINYATRFNFIHKIDIAACYDSMYTHSIAWAIHGRDFFSGDNRKNRYDDKLIGNIIDETTRCGRQNQTNGIPQGSLLSDLIAQIVLVDIDSEIANRLMQARTKKEFRIIRYMDDYNILTNSSQDGELIIKAISEILAKRRMRINPLKVASSNDIIQSTIKADRVPIINTPLESYTNNHETSKNISSFDRILQIYSFSKEYPNSGSLKRLLTKFRNDCEVPRYISADTAESVAVITARIARHNHKAVPICVSIIERALSLLDYNEQIIGHIIDMFNDVPYTEYIDIWLQRLIIGCGASHKQPPLSLMAKCVDRANEARSIWNNEWITSDGHNEARKIMQDTDIINPKLIDEIKPEIDIKNFRPWGYDR